MIKGVKQIGRYLVCAGIKLKGNGGFGMNELLGIAAALILAAFIIIPGLQDFADIVMLRLNAWWTGNIMNEIFPAGGS